MKKYKKIVFPLYLQIMLGMLIGIGIGFVALQFNQGTFIKDWIYPWGALFIRLLQLVAVPLVFISLVKGVTGLGNISRISQLGTKTISIYILTTIVAVLLGMALGGVIQPGKLVNKESIPQIENNDTSKKQIEKVTANLNKDQGPLALLNDIVPLNATKALSDNTKMLQIIFFALFLAIASLLVPNEVSQPFVKLVESLNAIILKMIDLVIRTAPIGVAALMADLVITFDGDASLFSALAVYAATVTVGLLILILFFYPVLIHFFTSIGIKKFMSTLYPVQLLGFSTSSSAATLPFNMETIRKHLGVSEETSSFVLPIGATINMDGTSCYQSISILFIAQVLDVHLSTLDLFTIIGMTIISSIGTPAIPGGSYVILAMVLTSVGIPPAGMALILGIDRPLDMLRTSVNVTGDAAVAAIVDKK